MDLDTIDGEVDPPRDINTTPPSFTDDDVHRWIWHSEATFNELLLPTNTMEQLERDLSAASLAVESAQERLEGLREGPDRPTSGENQPLVDSNTDGGMDLLVNMNPEEQELGDDLGARFGRPSDHSPYQNSRRSSVDTFETEYDPELGGNFQQAITGVEDLDHDQPPSRTSERSQEGMIAVEPATITQLPLSETLENSQEQDNGSEPNLVSQNLLSILQLPSFISAPLPRWTTPPQWLQFQMLRTYEDGLMTNGTQNNQSNDTYLTYTEEASTQIQTNFQSLLLNQPDDIFPTGIAQRWQQPEQWLQPSFADDSGHRPPVRFDGRFDDGLITAPPRVNDPSSTPSVTCHFGLMQQIGFGERKLEFYPETFSAMDAPFFANRVRSQACNTTDLMFLIITDWQSWFRKPLQDALPDFPIQTLMQFSTPQASTMLPSIDYNEGELTCIMEHINTHRKPQVKFANEREIDVGTTKAQCLPLVVWTRAQGAIESQPDRPVIVVISKRTDKITSKVTSHYSNDRYKRWDRLAKNQAWVYLDLYFLFTKWDRIWAAVKLNQQKRTEEVYARQNVLPILQQTRQLHKDNNIMISLREHVRIHKASLKIVMQRVEYMLGGVDFMATQGLKGRLDDAYQLLEYYEVTATTLLEQQQNLLSLAFNLETVSQGAAVARLNALAFVFLPLSFVASVFGITTFTAPPIWYPVAAVPVLLGTVFIAFAAHKFFTSQTLKESVAETYDGPASVNDLEKMPTGGSTTSNVAWTKVRNLLRRRAAIVVHPGAEALGPWGLDSTAINDPSRLTRRSTDRSLAARAYLPPRSTVQFIPGAYDLSNTGPSYFSSAPSQILGTQSYDFATGYSGGQSALYDGPYSQVSQLSSSFSPGYNLYQTYEPYSYSTVKGEADGTPSRPAELGVPFMQPKSSELGISYSALPAPSPATLSPLPIPPKQPNNSDDLYSADDNVGLARKVKALYDLETSDPKNLSFKAGEVITLSGPLDVTAPWLNGTIGLRSGGFPSYFVKMIDPSEDNVDEPQSTNMTSSQDEYNPYTTEIAVQPAVSTLYHDDGDSTGYRSDAPDSFGLPPDVFPSSFAGSTLEELAPSATVRNPGTIFGGLGGITMSTAESSMSTKLEPIAEESETP